jgi:hypothetical protein
MKDGLAESRLSLPSGSYGHVADRSRFRDKGVQLKQLETRATGCEFLERQRVGRKIEGKEGQLTGRETGSP